MSERDNLLNSIVNTVKDYRSGEIASPTPEHVDRWINQFERDVQVPMLREFDHVFKNTYLPRKRVLAFLDGLIKNQNLVGADPCDFWRKANFLRIQQNGHSQTEFLSLFDTVLESQCGFRTKDCGVSGDTFVYLDDVMFSGNRVGDDLTKWITEDAPDQATAYVIVMVIHTLGKWKISDRINREIENSEKNIQVKYWYCSTNENRKNSSKNAEVLWPAELPDNNDELNAYLARLHEFPFHPRELGGNPNLFLSDEGRHVLERELTLAGIQIQNFSANPSDSLPPLGFSPFRPGFGSTIVTFRNCPNNCPLALWWGDPEADSNHPFSKWYPLFPRKTY